MEPPPAEPDLTRVRRKDRAVTDDGWIAGFLAREPFGTLATVADGRPFVNSNLFVYHEPAHVLYLHTARSGRTRANVDGDARVCFTAARLGRLLPAAVALEMSCEYAGVVAFGTARVVADEAEARRALQLLLDKYFPHLRPDVDYRSPTPEELARTSVYRVAIEAWSGKRKEVAADFPGAFAYPHPAAAEAPR